MTSLTHSHILIVDDDANHRTMLHALLTEWGAKADEAASGTEAVELTRERPYDLVLMDVQMAEMTGIEALREIKAYNPAIPILIMTAYSNVENAVEAIKAGAYDYLPKPLEFDEFRLTMDRALDHAGLRRENQMLREQLGKSFDTVGIIGASLPMRKVLETLAMVAPSEATVLIYGESGTGKELFAKAIHANGQHKKGPFVAVNCAALSENLLESELFGHEKGAFTGADRRREGLFAQANKGTIFLDEIGEISPAMQVKLLRVIQEREFQRVGGDQKIRVDVRIVAATNRDLQEEVKAGRFRQDLFFRLNVVTLTIPPLRDRMEDVPLLASFFLERFAARNNKTVKGFTPGAMDRMMKYDWPGNVRELDNWVERLLACSDYLDSGRGGLLDMARLLEVFPECADGLALAEPAAARQAQLRDAGRLAEQKRLREVLESVGGDQRQACEILGISRATLWRRMKA